MSLASIAMMEHEDLIVEAMPRAKGRALAFSKRYPAQADADECISVAYMALVEAATRFQRGRELFWTFAGKIVDGRLLDMLRAHSQLTGARGKRSRMTTIGRGGPVLDRRFRDTRQLQIAVRLLSPRLRHVVLVYASAPERAANGKGTTLPATLGMSRFNFDWHRKTALAHLRFVLEAHGIEKVSDIL